MRFGHFFYPMNFDPSRDSQAIDNCLREAEMAETMGLDAVWLAEHHFTGEVTYGDSMVFASAIAARTSRVLIGFGVLEMALHNPVRLAIQTALLDNLSHGRLIVGTGRGATFNAYEYIGFGTTMAEGFEKLQEAEELLIKAWTTENVHHRGRFWQVSFPAVRPRPYQKPHPPLVRACTSERSIVEMGRIARPVLFRGASTIALGQAIQLYRDSMAQAGHDVAVIERALDQCWVWREVHLADSDEQAFDEFVPPFVEATRHVLSVQRRWNPPDPNIPKQPMPLPREAYHPTPNPNAAEALVGSPQRVVEQIAQLREAGARNLMLTNRGLLSPEQNARSMRLLCDQVIPKFR